ncbi:oligosaccharide flippase family protein [Mesorhizobium sp. CA14]|uniref:lipopolysaccharide biosynthesis protein n=1 Tax=Mesorhizobium sp. CA14 TaxID=2876642 RepID=UPI001CC915A0|nr:oligosaccharide flippase family protein [Mesorhizobium sp. CA14]MBZ9849992.1 oligosaccharide flippase family protein [Mesorhizobium sp. CA14]
MQGRPGSIATEALPVAPLRAPGTSGISIFRHGVNGEFDLPPVESQAISSPPTVDVKPKTASETHGLTRRLSHASLWAFFIYMAGAALTFVTQIAIARTVGPASYGIYAYVFAWIALLSYGSTLGFHVAVMRFVPTYLATKQFPMARGFILFGAKACIAAALLIAIVGAFIVTEEAHEFSPELAGSLLVGMATLPLVTVYLTGAGLVRAFEALISALLPERIVRDGLVLALVCTAASLTSWRLDAVDVMWMLLIASAVAAGITAFAGWRHWPTDLSSAKPAYVFRDWWPSLLPIVIMVFIDTLMNRTAVMLLGWNGYVKDAGIFSAAANMAMLVALPRVAVSSAFAPTIARLSARNDLPRLQTVFAKATILSCAGGLTLAFPLLIFTETIFHLFGSGFASGVEVTRILVVGQLIAVAAGPQQQLLTMAGHERAAATLMSVSAIINILGCIGGIALDGVEGAAISTSAMLIFWSVAQAVYVYSRLGIVPGAAWTLKERARFGRNSSAP